jgi:DNA-binding response OmpR family regulator
MVVEDDARHRRLFAAWLEVAGFNVVLVSDERTAIAVATTSRPDVALVDIRLPHLCGLDVIIGIRSATIGRPLPVVAISVLSSREDEEACLAAGADRFLRKPARMQDLVAAVRDTASRSTSS